MKNNSNLVLTILRSIQVLGAIIMINGAVVGFWGGEDGWAPPKFFHVDMVMTFSALLACNYFGRIKSQTEDTSMTSDSDQE